MSIVMSMSPSVRAEAAAWLARLRADGKKPEDECAFRSWLAESPEHAAAFEAVTEIWDVAGAAWAEPVTSAPVGARPNRRRILFAGVGSAVVASVGLVIWQSASAGVYETAIGEQRHVVLPDGTQVFLDTDTRIHASYNSQMREIALEQGRCSFHVMDSDLRPFVVDAAEQRIVTERTTFDVSRDDDEVCIVLVQGSASVGSAKAGIQRGAVIRAGQRLIARNGRIRIDTPNLVPLLAWQTGQAVFDNETVAGAVREMNRYSVVKIEVKDSSVAGMKLSGVYRVGDNAAFARSVAALLPVAVEVEANQIRLVVDGTRAKGT